MTGRGKAKVLLVLGLGALGFGAKLLKDQYDIYWPNDLPPTLAFYGGGLLAVSIALAIIKKPWVGIAVFVVGAGAAGGVIKLAQGRMADMEHGWAREREVQDTAEKVCDGMPNAAAAAGGKRGLMQVADTSGSDTKFASAWEGFPVPSTPAELQVVVCRSRTQNYVAVCDYANATGEHSYTIRKYQAVDYLTVKDAKTGEVLGAESFEGTKPSDKCDDSITTFADSHETSHEVSGDPPSSDAETAFVRPFVEHAEK